MIGIINGLTIGEYLQGNEAIAKIEVENSKDSDKNETNYNTDQRRKYGYSPVSMNTGLQKVGGRQILNPAGLLRKIR
jgi:hypothetical protein